MSKLVAAKPEGLAEKIELVLIEGDLAKLNPSERVNYYNRVCGSVGLNPLTRPFDYIRLNNKLVLYAKKDATDQLRKLYGVSIQITAREKIGDVYVVTAKAKMPDGREDESTGAVALGKLSGDALANAYMKAETKAKRRVTLSICGLGILDETEVESIPDAVKVKDAEISPRRYNENDLMQAEEQEPSDVPPLEPEYDEEAPQCCARTMMLSKYGPEPRPWYCPECKRKEPR